MWKSLRAVCKLWFLYSFFSVIWKKCLCKNVNMCLAFGGYSLRYTKQAFNKISKAFNKDGNLYVASSICKVKVLCSPSSCVTMYGWLNSKFGLFKMKDSMQPGAEVLKFARIWLDRAYKALRIKSSVKLKFIIRRLCFRFNALPSCSGISWKPVQEVFCFLSFCAFFIITGAKLAKDSSNLHETSGYDNPKSW